MSDNTTNTSPSLQPPGMGLPKIELLIARVLVGVQLRITSQEKARNNFLREHQEILSIIGGVTPELASKRVLIDRLRGLEDSSRFWSLYMTIEHLRIVNRSTINVINSLSKGIKPQVVVSTAAVKPREDIGDTVVPLFRAVCEEFESAFTSETNLKSETTLAHPWFGELNAQQWHFFAGFHMSLHKKQLLRIKERLTNNSKEK